MKYLTLWTCGETVFSIRSIHCSCHACSKKLSLPWYPKIKDAFSQPRYERVFNCKCSTIIGYNNNWVIMKLPIIEQMMLSMET